ncbi:MAG: RNA pseudouridine synthase [Bacteroidales bacterium]|nr:RNA pseudouridine synthase [Bacteroidales bacterium]
MQVLYEDNHIIAVNKYIGDLVQGDVTGDVSLDSEVKAYLKKKYNKPGDVFLGVVHRLDRPVSGVVIFARTSKALTRLNKLFQEHAIKKTYWAVVKNRPPFEEGELTNYLTRNSEKNKTYVAQKPRKGAKSARLTYKLLGVTNKYYLLEIDLHTGRHHQIRSQLAHIGCSIKGDLKYGFARSNPDGGIHLHARRLEFIHPVSNKEIVIIASPPQDNLWQEFVDQVNG